MEKDYQPAPEGEGPPFPWIEPAAFTLPRYPSFPFLSYYWFDHNFSPPMDLDPTYGISMAHSTSPISWPSMPIQQQVLNETTLPLSQIPASGLPPPPMVSVEKKCAASHRMLTNKDRRDIRLYYEANKDAKQTDIGGEINSLALLKSYLMLQFTDHNI